MADVYIDPWKPVARALITHGHADHSRWGHKHYLCTRSAAPVIKSRLGNIRLETIAYGEKRQVNGVTFSFHPAGHIIGSAQIRVEYKGEIWVASGDYKTQADGISEPFEAVKCHTFITESTFGQPEFRWADQASIASDINQWWANNAAANKTSVLGGYSLGKAQHILHLLDPEIGPVYTHAAVDNVNQVIRGQGIVLPETNRIRPGQKKAAYQGAIVIVPPGVLGSAWMKRFVNATEGVASGWMAQPHALQKRAVDKGFVLSDHADWPGLVSAVKATGAERVYVTHGYTKDFSRWLNNNGWEAHAVKTAFEGEY